MAALRAFFKGFLKRVLFLSSKASLRFFLLGSFKASLKGSLNASFIGSLLGGSSDLDDLDGSGFLEEVL